MKVKVIDSFFDIHTGELRPCGSVIEVTEQRFKEIEQDHHYVEQVNERKKHE